MVKQLEGLFAELSATLYGLPLLLWRVGRSPVRGTLRLYVLHRRKQEAHIGPHSAVLLAAVLISFWGGQTPWPEMVRQFAGGLLADASGLTAPIVTSVILAALIDGGCRFYARMRYARDVRRRSRAIATLLYAAAFGTVAIGPLVWLALLMTAATDRLGLPHGAIAVALFFGLLYAAAFAASWPLIAVYNAQLHTPAKDLQVQSLVPFVFLAVFMAGPALGSGVVQWIQTPPILLSSPYTTCILDNALVRVVAVLHNHTRDVLIVDSQNLGVRLTSRQSGGLFQLPLEVTSSSVAVAGGLISIPSDTVALVEATADPRHPKRMGNDLRVETVPEQCGLVKMNDRRPLWLGERGGGPFALLPSLAPLEEWPDPSQESFDGSGTVVDQR